MKWELFLDGDIFDCGDNGEYILANLEFAMKDT